MRRLLLRMKRNVRRFARYCDYYDRMASEVCRDAGLYYSPMMSCPGIVLY